MVFKSLIELFSMINLNNTSRSYAKEGGALMRLAHPLIVQCNNCARQLEVYADMECVCSEERSMGKEFTYESIIEDVCPNCGNSIRIQLTVWEYPICSVNYQEEKCSGAEIIEGPEYNPFDYDDDFF